MRYIKEYYSPDGPPIWQTREECSLDKYVRFDLVFATTMNQARCEVLL